MCGLDAMIHNQLDKPSTGKYEPSKDEASRSSSDSHGAEDITVDPNYDEADIFMDMNLYWAAKDGSLGDFIRALCSITSSAPRQTTEQILSRMSPAGNTLVHVAVKNGKLDIVQYVTKCCPHLIFQKNINGDTLLHLASKAGDEKMVEGVVPDIPIDARNGIVREKNMRGNTALHEALLHGRKLVAKYFIQLDHEILYYRNNEGETALYLAAKAGFADIVSLILQSPKYHGHEDEIDVMEPVHAAIRSNNMEVLETILNWNPNIILMRDEEGQTLLHFAVSLGHLKVISYLLHRYAPSASFRDKNGLCPIHVASYEGRVDIITLLLQYCPAPAELLDKYGGNILHTAANSGRYNVVKFILNNHKLDELINMKTLNGDSPLHVATMGWHPKIVSALTWDKRVDINSVNDKGMTALDVAEFHMADNPSFCQRLTWAALKSAGTPKSPFAKGARRTYKNNIVELTKERVNTLLLVSTLVATITFAAGFTLPGGYDSSAANLGMPTMLREGGFHIFLLSDSLAMYCSIIVVVILIYAQLGDPVLVLTALKLAVPLLGIALSMMSIAFTSGVYIVVSKHWLGAAGLFMGYTFMAILVILFLPLCSPDSSNNWMLRYISYYPFQLLILATHT